MNEDQPIQLNWEERAKHQIVELQEFPEYKKIDSENLDKEQLQDILEKYKVWNEEWDESKLTTLLNEVKDNERELVTYTSEDGTEKLAAHLQIISADVFHYDENGNEYKLNEAWFSRIRIDVDDEGNIIEPYTHEFKNRKKPRAVSEKMPVGETSEKGIVRALEQELGVEDANRYSTEEKKTKKEAKVSGSLPGLLSLTDVYVYRVVMKDMDIRDTESEVSESDREKGGKSHQTKMVRFEWIPTKSLTESSEEQKAA